MGWRNGVAVRDECWSEAIAVGSLGFVKSVKNQLGVKAAHLEAIRCPNRPKLTPTISPTKMKL